MKAIFFALAACAAAAPARADGSLPVGASQTVDDAVRVELTAEGLAGLTDTVRTAVLSNLQDVALPSVQQPLFAGVDAGLDGVKASVSFDSLSVVPEADGDLALDVGLRDLKVGIDSLSLGRTVFGHYFGTTCTSTEFHIAENDTVHFRMKLTPSIQATEIAFEARDVHFKVDGRNYRVAGPETCTGPLHGLVARPVLHTVLRLVRPFLETVIRDKVGEVLPVLAQQINEQTHVSAAFELAGLPALPEVTAGLELFPSTVAVDEHGMKIAVGVRISNEPLPINLYSLHYRDGVGAVRYGSLGVNPSLVTAAFTALWPQGTDWYDVSDKLSGLLDTNSWADVLPDLKQANPTEPTLHVAARLGAAPQISVDQATGAVVAHLPVVELKLQVNLNHQWVDYYILSLDVNTGATAAAANDSLEVSLLQNSAVKVQGRWADTYKPVDPSADLATAQQLFEALFQLLGGNGPVYHVALPKLDLGRSTLLIGNPHVDQPYVVLDVTAN